MIRGDLEGFLAKGPKRIPWTGTKMAIKRAELAHQRGIDVVGLSGAPRGPLPEHVLEAVARAARANAYAPSHGLAELRQAIADKLGRDHGLRVDPESEVLVTVGAKQALYVVLTALLDPGDEVLMPSPTYNFHGTVELVGGTPVFAPTAQESGFRWDVDALGSRITRRTKVLIINTPANPTGFVADRGMLAEIAALAEQHDLLVLADESFERLVYDGRQHVSFASLPGMFGRTITVQSCSKRYALPGWRVGYVVGPAALSGCFRKVLEWMVLTCPAVAQSAAAAAMTGPQDWLDRLIARQRENRDRVMAVLREIPDVSFAPPAGGGCLFVNIAGLGVSPEEASDHLLETAGIPTVPGPVFISDQHVRLNFGGTEEAIAKVCERLPTGFRSLARAKVSG